MRKPTPPRKPARGPRTTSPRKPAASRRSTARPGRRAAPARARRSEQLGIQLGPDDRPWQVRRMGVMARPDAVPGKGTFGNAPPLPPQPPESPLPSKTTARRGQGRRRAALRVRSSHGPNERVRLRNKR